MRKFTRSRLGLLFVVTAVAALVAVPVALAQDPINDPTSAQYDPPISGTAGGAAGAAQGGGAAGGEGLESNIGSLPFTGMDLIIVAGVAFLLTGTGFALRRLSTPRGPRV
ncbi:MAG: hypothetical protein ACRDL6_09985 [Solirubrobacterales bacterium]